MDWGAVFAGIGAIITAAGGCILVISEFRRRDRRALRNERDELSRDVSALRNDLVICRRYSFELAEYLTDLGHDVPAAHPLHDQSEM